MLRIVHRTHRGLVVALTLLVLGGPSARAAPPPSGGAGAAACGDGVAAGIEECDDGNTTDGDGCSAACALESASAVCAGVPTVTGTAIATELVVDGLDEPVHVAAPPLDPHRLFVVEQRGTVRVVDRGVLRPEPFLDLTDRVVYGGERGLLSIVFHPDFERTGRFFVNYTRRAAPPPGKDGGAGASRGTTKRGPQDGADPMLETAISRFRVSRDPHLADRASELVLLTVRQDFANHNGGQLAFGPDGFLYVGMGDGGAGGDRLDRAQDPTSLLGKMLRMDVDVDAPPHWRVPADNPAPVASARPAAGRRPAPDPLRLIWATGLRNPWRFGFDRATGELYIADVGQHLWEEVNVQPPGKGGLNWGWDFYEGSHCFEIKPPCTSPCGEMACASWCPPPVCPPLVAPVLEYCHEASQGPACGTHPTGCSITGGFVYRGCRMPDLHGRYFYADFCNPFIRSFKSVRDGAAQALADHTEALDPPGPARITDITSFGEDARGELYIADIDGEVFRIVPR